MGEWKNRFARETFVMWAEIVLQYLISVKCTIFERFQKNRCGSYARGLFSVHRLLAENITWCSMSVFSYTLLVERAGLY
jgi:hypothetical protein